MRLVGLLVALAAAGTLAAAAQREPAPLAGAPLGPGSGLRLAVSDGPPFVLDVDTGRARRAAAPPLSPVVSVLGVGGRAAVVVSHEGDDSRHYALRGAGRRLVPLGSGRHVVPAADGRSVWILRRVAGTRCAVRRVGLDGRILARARSFPCAATLDSAGALGLVVDRTRVVDPRTGRTRLRTRWGILAAAGRTLLLAGPGARFTLLDTATGSERRIRRPSILRHLDGPPLAHPNGRSIAIGFADPAWQLSGDQVMDVWLLDVRTGRLDQVPGMPAFVGLKRTSTAWSADGRLVVLGEGEREFVATWRPGEPRLSVKRVRLPDRSGASDTFAPLG